MWTSNVSPCLKVPTFRANDLLQFPANELSLPLSRNWCYYIKNHRVRFARRGNKGAFETI